MAEEKDKKEPGESLELKENGDGTVTVVDPKTEEQPAKKAEEADERPASTEDEDEHAEGEEQASGDETPEQAEARKQRNREWRAANKARRKEQIDSLKRELATRDRMIQEMNQRLAVVERKSTGSEMAQLENYEREAQQVYNHFKQVNQQAIEQANGAAATEAQEKMFLARQRMEQIANIKKAMSAPAQQPQSPTQLDPRLVNLSQQWMAKNEWYNPTGNDADSRITRTIDDSLAEDGFDPTTPEYWRELDARVKKYLPHRTKLGHNSGTVERAKSASPVAAGGNASAATSSREYTLSPERVQALKDAGMWDDPAKRTAMIRRYQQIDKEQRV